MNLVFVKAEIIIFLLNLTGPSILFNYASLKYWARAMCLECKYGLKESIFKDYIMVGPTDLGLDHVVKQNDWTEGLCFIAMSVTGTKDLIPFKCLF
jgi:hypothetical protein